LFLGLENRKPTRRALTRQRLAMAIHLLWHRRGTEHRIPTHRIESINKGDSKMLRKDAKRRKAIANVVPSLVFLSRPASTLINKTRLVRASPWVFARRTGTMCTEFHSQALKYVQVLRLCVIFFLPLYNHFPLISHFIAAIDATRCGWLSDPLGPVLRLQ
jgi:hypothetical protein